MPDAAATSAPPTGRHQRRLKNYVLDAHFQFKYTGYLVGIALMFGICLGTLLWRTSTEVIAQSSQTVAQGEQVVGRGREATSVKKSYQSLRSSAWASTR